MKYFVSLMCCTFLFYAFGQDTVPKIRRSEIQFHTSFGNSLNVEMNENEWYSYLQQFPSADSLLSYSDSHQKEGYYYNATIYFSYARDLQDKRPDDKWSTRFSLSYGMNESNYIDEYWRKEIRKTYDTIVFMQSGEKQPVDSIITTVLGRRYTSWRHCVGIGYHWKYEVNKRFWSQFGTNVFCGFATDRKMSGYEYVSAMTTNPYDSTGMVTLKRESRTYNARISNDVITLQFPVEFYMRLSVKPNFWNHLSLGVKVNPMVNCIALSDKRYTQFSVGAGTSWTYHF